MEHWGAIGILEALWHLTAREAPSGDIGKLTNEDIAYGIWWKSDPDQLVTALIECGWLDVSEDHRIVIHDWHEHADDGVHHKLLKTRKFFSDGSMPSLSRLPKSEREEIAKQYERIKALKSASERSEALALPSLAIPEPEPDPEENRCAPPPVAWGPKLIRTADHPTPEEALHFSEWCEHRYAKHPKKRDKMISLKSMQSRFCRDPAARDLFEHNHDLHCETDEWREKNGAFAPKLWEFIENDGWKYPPIQPSKQQNGKGWGMMQDLLG